MRQNAHAIAETIFAILVLALAFIFWAGCRTPDVNINIDNGNSAQNGGPTSPTGIQPSPGACSALEETPIRVNINAPAQVVVGMTENLDATPKSASGPRSDACNLFQGIAWTTNPTDVCQVSDPADFTPKLRGLKVGTCVITATVPGKNVSGSVNVPVIAAQ